MKKEYQWKDVVVSMGGKEVDFKPIPMDKNDSVFEGDIEILIEDLKSVATQEKCRKNKRYYR